jgi:mono/diheme cytochrome c family protein
LSTDSVAIQHTRTKWLWSAAIALFLLNTTACELRREMYDQPKIDPLEASVFFADGLSARQPIPGTVARGQLRLDPHLYQGKVNGELATTLPYEITQKFIERGQERFNIFCAPCHDRTGRGNGMIVQRGFKAPPSMHEQRLRDVPIGHFFDVMTNGFGVMYSYASRIPVKDRWAIAAYIRALQFSQNAHLDHLSAEDRNQLPE